MCTMFRAVLVGLLIFAVSTPLLGQTQRGNQNIGGAEKAEERSSGGPRKQLATIIFAGLGGAILGLSTLSFYGRPQDKLVNIGLGFAFGVIAGTTYVTYKAVSNPQEFYSHHHSPAESITPMKLSRDSQVLVSGLPVGHQQQDLAATWRLGWTWEF